MRTSGITKVAALSALVCALGGAPQKADAAVVTTGCASATQCTLSELLTAGSSFLINETRFENFTFAPFAGLGLNPAAILVTPIDQFLNPGFRLTDTDGTLRAADGAVSGSEVSFNVTMTGGPLRIKDNTLAVTFGQMTNPGVETFAEISETVFNSDFSLIGNKDVLCDTAACANSTGFDDTTFAPQTSLLVFANIGTFSSATGDVAQIVGATLNFSQIPEPTTVALLALGMTGIGWSRRRRMAERA